MIMHSRIWILSRRGLIGRALLVVRLRLRLRLGSFHPFMFLAEGIIHLRRINVVVCGRRFTSKSCVIPFGSCQRRSGDGTAVEIA